MRISFDLDDTLICYGSETPCENPPRWYRRVFTTKEPLRLGTPSLMNQLEVQGWELWIFTTSNRKPRAVRRWLKSYGIRIDGVINQTIYDEHNQRVGFYRPPSKNPAAFGIDLHVDDSEGVQLEGIEHGFRVVVVSPDDDQWAAKVLTATEELLQRRNHTRSKDQLSS